MKSQDYDNSEYKGWRYITVLTLDKTPDGLWRVINRVRQERSLDMDAWEEKEVQFVSIHKELEQAISESWMDTAQYLDSVGHDLFIESATPAERVM